jgi:hypothetical protein
VVGSTTRQFPAGEHFLTIPLNAIAQQKVHSKMRLHVTGNDSPGHPWTEDRVPLPLAS